jgi:gamma-glutamyltranspeptidase/glutathione hydrolase
MMTGVEVTSPRGVVAANPPAAAAIGAEVLEAGGNAMEAAVAAGMACCMLQPHMTGIAGYVCSAVVLDGRRDRVWSVDANSMAPAAAHERMFAVRPREDRPGWNVNEDEYGCTVHDDANVIGPLSVGPPGMLAGMGTIWERWGRRPWASIVAPSQTLLSDGFPYDAVAPAIRSMRRKLERFPETIRHLMPAGRLPKPDEVWHRPDMETTLARVAAAGWQDFYTGELAHRVSDYIVSAGGILSRADLAAYAPRVGEPYRVGDGARDVYGPILTNGALTVLQAVNMLQSLEIPASDTPAYWHLLAEVLKLAWRDRLDHLADPDFADVPVGRLLDRAYAGERVAPIRRDGARVDRETPPEPRPEPDHTLHVSSADAEGNLVAMTISQGMLFGSCVTVPGTGMILGHAMCRLDPRPGRVNSIAARKRPLNNTAPLLIRLPERDVAIGLPGGRRIVSVMARAAHLILSRGVSAREAAIAPRLHVERTEPLELQDSVSAATVEALRAMGHDVRTAAALGGCMNGAEWLKGERRARAGSGVSAAGAA